MTIFCVPIRGAPGSRDVSLLLEALRKAEKQSLLDRDAALRDGRDSRGDAAAAPACADGRKESLPSQTAAREGRPGEGQDESASADLALEPAPELTAPELREPVTAQLPRDEVSPGPPPTRGRADQGPGGAYRWSPFYAVLALSGAVALAAIGYFWHQLPPAPRPVDDSSAVPSLPNRAVAVAQTAPTQLAIPGLPDAVPQSRAASAAVVARVSPAAASRPSASSVPRPAADTAAPPIGPGNIPPVQHDRDRIHPQVEAGYTAWRNGNLDAARTAYERALREEPDNADAIRGMAVLEMYAGNLERAEAHYLGLLQAIGSDAYARAGLIALRTDRTDPLQVESSLKALLAAEPEAVPLILALGNQFARQGRWAEAQQAFFRAAAGDPDNPDIAFNLAVSLDRLHRSAEAIVYYGRALALAEHRVARFSPEVARLRLQQLAR